MQKNKFTTIDITYLALMTAACVVGRFAFQFIPNFQPMTSMFLLFTLYFGLYRGVIVCVLSIIISNFYFGMGVWTMVQILSFTILLVLFKCFCFFPYFRSSILLQSIYAVLSGYMYGFILSFLQLFIYSIPNFWIYYLQGVSFDTLHAVGNGMFYFLLAPIAKRVFLYQRNQIEQHKRRNKE